MDNLLNQFAWWKITTRATDEQVLKYSTLGTTKSARGISSLLILAIAAINIVFVFLSWAPPAALYESVLYLALAIFVYKGNRLATLTVMALWTLDKGYSLYEVVTNRASPFSLIAILLWWAVFMRFFYATLVVENLRQKHRREAQTRDKSLVHSVGVSVKHISLRFLGKEKAIIFLALAALTALAFYWFQWRPAQIRQECYQKIVGITKTTSGLSMQDLNAGYEFCLHNKGF